MSKQGTVRVVNGRYKFSGEFHHATPNTPITNDDEGGKLVGVTNPRDMTYVHTYGGEAVFFEGLGKGILYGTRCDNPKCEFTGTQYIPFRIHCPDCLGRNTVVDFTKTCRTTATVHTFMVCERSGAFNVLDKPIKFINIEFEGVGTILMSYLSLGEPTIGMKVVPIFRTTDPTFTITDLSWVPEGADEGDLPDGFTFG
ncbi:hypothetical protein LCGC14_0016080 [marine sediment metagenome]|uniref:DUF35 domain-containing protein n=1 Tax=marine sediment metagenome TaxID=412755 RepID=A0A0F9YG10_9ZZZZ|nr:hypothetical protein [Phycisphaerae bacterium]HDZ42820.1 hypothetical protein [Phycisphaerae bacterium]